MADNEEFVKSIEKATLKIIADTAKNMQKACLVVERDAKQYCPVDTGTLRASIQHRVDFNTKEITGTVFSSLSYAPYIHQGTGIYAIDGNGRKAPWKYQSMAGKYKGWHITKGNRPKPFLDFARIYNVNKVNKILAGK